jgi:superfamily I DNA/RNA helicase
MSASGSARSLLFGLAALLCVPLTVACAAGSNASSPEAVLSSYARAIQRGHLAEAYALLSDDAKKSINFEEFKRMIQENPEQAQELVRALDRPQSGPPRVTAKVTGADGEPLLLVYESGAWRVDGSAIDLYSQATPESAALAFLRAVENKRYDVLLRFVPDSQRDGLSEATLRSAWEGEQKQDMARLSEALKAALPTAHFEVVGERATLAYGAGGTIELVREHGAWKVEELK